MPSVTRIGSTHISRVGFAKEQDGRGAWCRGCGKDANLRHHEQPLAAESLLRQIDRMAQKGTYLKSSLFVVVAAAWAPQIMSSAIDWMLKMRVGGADTPGEGMSWSLSCFVFPVGMGIGRVDLWP